MNPSSPDIPADAKPHRRFASVTTAIHDHVEHALHTRHAPKGTTAARLEDRVLHRADQMWSKAKDHPSIGILLAAAAGLGLASAVGAGELLFGVSAGYAAYLILREHVSPAKAVKQTAHFEE